MYSTGKFLINCKAPFNYLCNLGQPPSKRILDFDPGDPAGGTTWLRAELFFLIFSQFLFRIVSVAFKLFDSAGAGL
jgi:hypothetical protein